MNKFFDGIVALLPTLLAVVAMWVQPPRKKHPMKWRLGLLLFGVLISGLTFWQMRHQRQESQDWAAKAARVEGMLRSAQEGQRLTQQKLDESIRREQRLNDQNNDLRTDLLAQNELLQIIKGSLPLSAQKQAEQIHKHWVRELSDGLNVQDAANPTQR